MFPWYALWVRSRHEKSVAGILTSKGYQTFLPMHRSRRRWSDRIQEVELPLIPGYVFCRFDALNRLPVMTTPGLVQIVSLGHTPEPVDSDEMNALITAVEAGVHLQLWPFLKTGQRVSIEEGPLRSLEGILISTKGTDQLILSVSLLQRSVAVAVDRRSVRPVRESGTRNIRFEGPAVGAPARPRLAAARS
jgi:transcription antitermination factor NusG